MPKSTEKKAQHVVSKGYFRRWRDAKFKFHLLDLDADTVDYTDNMRDTFSLLHYYDHVDIDNQSGTFQTVENFLARIESITLGSLGRVLSGLPPAEFGVDPVDWLNVLWLVVVQYLRTPSYRNLSEATRNQVCATIIRQYVDRNYGAEAAYPVVSFDAGHEHLRELLDIDHQEKLLKELKQMYSTILVNQTGKVFITSDNPVSACPTQESGRPVFLGDDGFFVVPLSPEVAILFRGKNHVDLAAPRFDVRMLTTEQGFVGELNRWVAMNAQNEVLCRSGEFYGLEAARASGELQLRGVEVICQGFSGEDVSKSYLVTETFFKARHKVLDTTPKPRS